MDLKAAILKEHSKKQCDRIVKYISDDKLRFAALTRLFFSGEYRITQRAAWPLSYCVQHHPSLINPYFKKLLLFLKRSDVHPAVERNILRLLQDANIPTRWEGEVMDICFRYIANPAAAIAPKAFALGILKKLSKKYPDIIPEIKVIVDERWHSETPAFKARAREFRSK